MYKLLALLGVLAVVIVVFVWEREPSVVTVNDREVVLGSSVGIEAEVDGWNELEFTNLSFSIRVPKDLMFQEHQDSIEVYSQNIKLIISAHALSDIETVNTIAEKEIGQKSLTLGENFSLREPIEPIAISSVTGVVYTTLENEKEITYIYVPREHSYILIENHTDVYSPELSTSDQIAYSLKLL